MDFFGIGTAIKGAVQIYSLMSRNTGRTTLLVQSLKDGDRVVFATMKDADRFKLRLRELAKMPDITVAIIPVERAGALYEHRRAQGRTIFDHVWIERFYQQAIDQAVADIDRLQNESSITEEERVSVRQAAEARRFAQYL